MSEEGTSKGEDTTGEEGNETVSESARTNTSARNPSTSRSSAIKSVRSTSWLRDSSLKDDTTDSSTPMKTEICSTPFILQWSFGLTWRTPVFNLTSKDRSLICYSVSHAGIMYDYVAKKMYPLQGHKNHVSDISMDETGKWIVTADRDDDSSIIIWDSYLCLPVHTIFSPHLTFGTALVKISPNAKYLISIGNEPKPQLKFWLWTFGNETSDDAIALKNSYGKPVTISFNPNVQEHFMVACEKTVLFFTWCNKTGKIIEHPLPDIRVPKHGICTCCTYVDKCHECFASTSEGCVWVFGNGAHFTRYENEPLCNEKFFAKTIKVVTTAINCLATCDGLIASGDAGGNIRFYDKMMKILYWCQNFSLSSVTSISFSIDPRQFTINEASNFNEAENELISTNDNQFEDRSEEIEQLFVGLVPFDATLQRLPFIVRDFIIATEDGSVATIDYIRNNCNFLFRKVPNEVVAIDVHCEENYICVAHATGRICLYNYISRELMASYTLPEEIDNYSGETFLVAALKYSPESIHLVCGKTNGHVWFLDPIALTPKYNSPQSFTAARIIKFVFSMDCQYLAYYDENFTVCLIKYCDEEDNWYMVGKLRPHSGTINDILFTPYLPSRLLSIGNDKLLIEYDLLGSEKECKLEILSMERIEQTATPRSFVYYPKDESGDQRYLLMSDDQFKYKKFHDGTLMCRAIYLAPAYGCYKECPVNKMAVLPGHNDKYLIYANDKYIGIQMLPIDGNPYKYVGMVGHPRRLLEFKICREGTYLFTIGENDCCILMWKINVEAVELMAQSGGTFLTPFYCLIEGGFSGWLFREMQDLFYYMQILHQGENTVVTRTVTDDIPIIELPDLMRACGFYPTEYEIETLLQDIKYRDYDTTQKLKDVISFYEFVNLYINHRPAHGTKMQTLKDSFDILCRAGQGSKRVTITGPSFINIIRERGEFFNMASAHKCLKTLMHYEPEEEEQIDDKDFSFLPDEIDFSTFLEDMLGMDLDRQTVEESDAKPYEVEENVEQLC